MSKYRHFLFATLFAGYLLSVFQCSGIQLLQFVTHFSQLNDFSHQVDIHGHKYAHKLIKPELGQKNPIDDKQLVFFELIEKIEIPNYTNISTNTSKVYKQDNFYYTNLNGIVVIECAIPPPQTIS